MCRLMGVQIVGTGSFLPRQVVTNEDLASLGCDAEWIVSAQAFDERRHAPPEMTTARCRRCAAEQCLEAAGVDPADVDLLILATFTPDRLMPATATDVQHRLGLQCGAFDLSAVCAGFTYALATGMQFVAAGRKSMRIGDRGRCDLARATIRTDKKTLPAFSATGPARCLLAHGSAEQGAARLCAWAPTARGTELLYRPPAARVVRSTQPAQSRGAWYMQMEGRPVFKWAVRLLEESSQQVLDAAGVDRAQVDWWLVSPGQLCASSTPRPKPCESIETKMRDPHRPLRQHVCRQHSDRLGRDVAQRRA